MTSIERVRRRAEQDARMHGYHLTSDSKLLATLLNGLLVNEERYGYPSCPCRMATGIYEVDRDIICPCDYRDPDVIQYGACYCCLYVDKESYDRGITHSIPERRPRSKQMASLNATISGEGDADLEEKRELYYCRQCGYTVYREEPPYICPICRAKREFFSKIPPNRG